MQQVIGFTMQNIGDGACGKFAIQHALLLLGLPVSQKDINKATRLHPIITRATGVGPSRIIRGLEALGCRGLERACEDATKFRYELDGMLDKGYPCILSVEAGSHWAVIAGRSGVKYYWIDSADEDVVGCWKWRDIVEWIDSDLGYLIAAKPMRKLQLRHSLVPSFSRIATLLEDHDLREYWGYYLQDLLECFDCPDGASDAITARGFFSCYGKQISAAVAHQYLYADEERVAWEMSNYRKVAVAHNLTISKAEIPWAIADLTAALAVIVCTE
jgi:hypothetical protein